MNKKTGKMMELNPNSIKQGDSAIVVMQPDKKVSVEVYEEYPELGRFAVIDMKMTVAVGVVKSIRNKMNPG